MIQYEYLVKTKSNSQSLQDFLNQLAGDGWRYLHNIPTEGYIFEREKVEKPKATRKRTTKTKKVSKSDG